MRCFAPSRQSYLSCQGAEVTLLTSQRCCVYLNERGCSVCQGKWRSLSPPANGISRIKVPTIGSLWNTIVSEFKGEWIFKQVLKRIIKLKHPLKICRLYMRATLLYGLRHRDRNWGTMSFNLIFSTKWHWASHSLLGRICAFCAQWPTNEFSWQWPTNSVNLAKITLGLVQIVHQESIVIKIYTSTPICGCEPPGICIASQHKMQKFAFSWQSY